MSTDEVILGHDETEQTSAAAVDQVWVCRTNPTTKRIITAVHGGYADTTLGRTSVANLLRNWRLIDADVQVGQTWRHRDGHERRTVIDVTADNVITDKGLISRLSFVGHWRLVQPEELEAAGLPGGQPATEQVTAARTLLAELGHAVTGDLERDIDRAIDVERQRREHDLQLVALTLEHSIDTARAMRRDQVLEAVRAAVIDRDRCRTCPWIEVGRSIECGGAAGICPGNTRPTIAQLLERYPEPTP